MMVVLLAGPMGCTSAADIRNLRDLPGTALVNDISRFEYDSSVRAYRLKTKSKRKGEVVRDPSGRKIRTKEELQRWIEASKSVDERIWSRGMTTTGVALAVIYVPVGIVF